MQSLNGTVSAEELHSLTYNVLQYSGKDTTAQGSTCWHTVEDQLYVTAYDDYFALTDSLRLDVALPNLRYELDYADLQALEKHLRDRTGPLDLDEISLRMFPKKVLLDAEEIVFGIDSGHMLAMPYECPDFAVSPDRLRRLSLLKPKGYPIDFRMLYCEEHDAEVLGFRYGPTVRGVIATLKRHVLRGMYEGEEIWR